MLLDAYTKGSDAAVLGWGLEECPYSDNAQRPAWLSGWWDQRALEFASAPVTMEDQIVFDEP